MNTIAPSSVPQSSSDLLTQSPKSPASAEKRTSAAKWALQIERMDSVKIKPIKWLIPDCIPSGNLTLFDGDPGTNKSTLTLAIAAAVTTGNGNLFGREVTCDPSKVLIVAPEDNPSTTIAPRLIAAGADLSKVGYLKSVISLNGQISFLQLDKHLEVLEARIKKSAIKFIIFDPLMAHLGSSVKSKDEQACRHLMLGLSRIAEETDAVIIGIRHLNKGDSLNALYRGTGSIAFTATARSVFLIALDPREPPESGWRIAAQAKANLSSRCKPYRFHVSQILVPCTGTDEQNNSLCIDEWQEADVAIETLLFRDKPQSNEHDKKINTACELLKIYLADGPKRQSECMEEGKLLELSNSTMHRAKVNLGITAKKVCTGDEPPFYTWQLKS